MTDDIHKLERRWPRARLARFSLRTLLVAVTLLAAGLAVFAHWRAGKRREDAAQWLLDHGASVWHVDGRPMQLAVVLTAD